MESADRDEQYYRAVVSRDCRFDGWFVTAVHTTGIYCRPSCPATTPRRRNVSFFATAAADFTATFRVLVGVPGNFVPSNAVKLVAPGSNPTLSVGVSGGATVITYTATLQSAPAITGPWQNVTGATSPYTVPTTGTVFFRTVR